MNLDAFYELSRRSIIVNKIEETTLLWHNSTLVVRTEKGLHFMNYSHNLECLDKKIDFIETYTPSPTSSPASKICAGNFVKKGMNNLEYTEMILNPALWAYNTQIVKNLINVSVMEWSPVDFLQNNQCALAALNNIGSVELYGQIRDKWVNIFSLSAHVNQIIGDQITVPENLHMLKHVAYAVHACAICWAPKLISKNSCYLVTAQKTGDLLFWLLKSNGVAIDAKLQGVIKSETCEICSMLWIPVTQEKCLLVCSTVLGQIVVFDCVIEKEEIKCITSQTLWHHKDRMIVKCLKYINIENNNVLICIKHRHLVVQMFDEQCKILTQYISNVNDHRITGIAVTGDGIFLSTINFQIYKVNIKVLNAQLIVNLDTVENKEHYTDYEVSSIGFSPNNSMCSIGMTERKVLCRKEPIKIDIVFMTTEKRMESAISVLLNNPTKKLTDYWDCIELLRYKSMRTNKMPLIDYNQLYTEGQTNIYKLKLYLVLLKIYNLLKKTARIRCDILFPETCIENVNEQIFCNQARDILNNLNGHKKEQILNNFQIESFCGAKRYIDYYCQKHNKNVSDLVNGNMLDFNTDSSPAYTCQCCDKRLDGFSCEDGHLNMFCSISLTLIENIDEYLVCKNCGLTARTELFPDKPMCLICDFYLCVA